MVLVIPAHTPAATMWLHWGRESRIGKPVSWLCEKARNVDKEVSASGLVCSSPVAQADQELSQGWMTGGMVPFCTVSLGRRRGFSQSKSLSKYKEGPVMSGLITLLLLVLFLLLLLLSLSLFLLLLLLPVIWCLSAKMSNNTQLFSQKPWDSWAHPTGHNLSRFWTSGPLSSPAHNSPPTSPHQNFYTPRVSQLGNRKSIKINQLTLSWI